MPVGKEEAQKVVGAAYLKGAQEAGKEDAKAKGKELSPRAQQVRDLIDAAVANPGVGMAITVYRRGTGTLRTEEKWIGVIDYVAPMDLKTWGIEAIVEDYSGGGAYRTIIKVPQLDFEPTEVYFSIDGKQLPPKPKREQAASMGISVEQLIAQESGQPIPRTAFGPVGPGTPQMGGLPMQQMGMQSGYGMQQPYGNPQVHMGAPYGGYPQQQYGQQYNPLMQQPFGPQTQFQPPQPSALEKLTEKLADRALNPPVVQKDDDDNKALDAITKMMEEQNRRWEETERRRREDEERREERRRSDEERRRDREESERRWQETQAAHVKEVREMELRYETERDERRWKEMVEGNKKDDKNPTIEMISALAPVAASLVSFFGSKEDASVKVMELMMARPTNEDRIAKLSEILGSNMATNVGLVGTILTTVLADKAGDDRPPWLDVLMQLIDQGGDVAKVALGGMMEEEEEEEAGEERRLPPPGAQQQPRQQRMAPPPGAQQQQPGAQEAAMAARQRIAAAQAQMEKMRQAQAQSPPAQEGQVIDIPNQPPSTAGVSIQNFDSAMQTLFGMVSGDDDPHEIAFLLWKHAASGVRSAVEWLNHGADASRFLLGALRRNDELTVTDQRIEQVGSTIQELFTYLQQGGSPEDYAKQHKIQRGMPKSTRIDPVRSRVVQQPNRTTASLDGQGQAAFGEGREAEVQQRGSGDIKARTDNVPDTPQQADDDLPPDQNPFAKKPLSAAAHEPDPDAIAKGVEEMTAKARAVRQAQDSTKPAPTVNPALGKKPPKAKMAPKPASKEPTQLPSSTEEPPVESGP